QKHGVNRCEIVGFPVQNEEDGKTNQVAPTQRSIGLETRREEQGKQPRQPDGRSQKVNQQYLVKKIFGEGKDDVAAFGANVAHQFDEGPMMVDTPQKIGQEDQERGKATEPDPRIQKSAALLSQEKPDDKAKAEDGN